MSRNDTLRCAALACALGVPWVAIADTRVIAPIAPPGVSPAGVTGITFDGDPAPLVVDGFGRALWRIDVNDASVEATFSLPPPETGTRSLELDSATGEILTLRRTGDGDVLAVVAPGLVSDIGPIGAFNFANLAVDPTTGQLWLITDCLDPPACGGAGGSTLWTVDRLTGAATFVHDLGIGQATAIAISEQGRMIVAARDNDAVLHEVDPSTGASFVLEVAAAGVVALVDEMAFDPASGRLFAIARLHADLGARYLAELLAEEPGEPADLELTMSAIPDAVTPGAQLNYQIQVVNNGPGTALGVTVTDTLPPGVTFRAARACRDPGDCSECVEANGVVLCDLPALAAGGAPGRVFIAVLATDALGTITNRATVFSDTEDPDLDNNFASLDTQVVAGADLALELLVTGHRNTNDTFTVTNLGPDAAERVTVVLGVSNATVQSISSPVGVTCERIEEEELSCTLAGLAAGESAQILVATRARGGGGTVVHFGGVFSATPDPVPDNNLASFTRTLPGASVTKSNELLPTEMVIEIPCADDLVALSGDVHAQITVVTRPDGSGHFEMHFTRQLRGIGLDTGDAYHATGVTLSGGHFARLPSVETFINRFHLVSPGPGNDLIVRETFHLVIDRNGEAKAFHDHFVIDCR